MQGWMKVGFGGSSARRRFRSSAHALHGSGMWKPSTDAGVSLVLLRRHRRAP